ncbi:MAG TPA: phosphoribosylformylglycinamidine synthase subunit PurQ [Acidimicrobiales bacterium]|jgi:phosphoribosylformylglycinamidine synthase|nr:phosphoribosylformylglycinamidine synthase subunit PurQ [Acidimicrobiales bacterium]
MTSRVAVVVFPGSNCEHDVVGALQRLGGSASLVWHESRDLEGADGVVVPGGFAHGDYLRPGAIARFSPIMESVAAFASAGRPVLGICNGFQVLSEAGLVPGALRPNDGRRFLCKTVICTVASTTSSLTAGLAPGQELRLPINHYEGNYTIPPDQLARLEANGQVVLRYTENPNGSIGSVAGVANERGNVVGLMPHPERASDPILGSGDGVPLLEAFLRSTVG